MRLGLPFIQIFSTIVILAFTVPLHAQSSSITVDLRSEEDQLATNEELKKWWSEPIRNDFAHYMLTQDINPLAPNGKRYPIFKSDQIRVYGKPVKRKDGMTVVTYRSPNIVGCMYSDCKMAVPENYLYKTTASPIEGGNKVIYNTIDAITKTWNDFFKAPAKTGTQTQTCANCETVPSKAAPAFKTRPRPVTPAVPVDAKALDRSIEWLKHYIGCDEYEYLKTQRKNLLEAERIFKLPATVMACLIARESRWDINTVQMSSGNGKNWGSYVGLPQTREDALNTERNFLNNSYDQIYRHEARQQIDECLAPYTPQGKPSIGLLVESNIYHKTSRANFGSAKNPNWELCGPAASAQEANRIGRISICSVGNALNRFIDYEVTKLTDAGRGDEGLSLLKTKYSKALMATGGYNAGWGYTFGMTPKAAYVSDNLAWIHDMYPPPFVSAAIKNIEAQCSKDERIAANRRKLIVITRTRTEKVKVAGKNKAGKPIVRIIEKKVKFKALPKASDVACSTEWLAVKTDRSRFSDLQAKAVEKQKEVKPYVKWIADCMSGDPSVRPPMKGSIDLDNPKFREKPHATCYPADPLKSCPAPPPPKPKAAKPAAKPGAKAPTKPAPKGKK